MGDDKRGLQKWDATEDESKGLDALSFLASASGGIASAAAHVLSGYANERKFQRVYEVLALLGEELENLEDRIDEEYVSSEEFEDLLDETLQKASKERAEEKRRLFSTFLASASKTPEIPYDEKMKHLGNLEALQQPHIQMLRAMIQEPDANLSGNIGSLIQTFQKRTGLGQQQIREYAADLNRLGIASLDGLGITMTARGAEDLSSQFTPYGKRFMDYILGST